MQQELEVEVRSLYEMIDRKHTIRSANRFKIFQGFSEFLSIATVKMDHIKMRHKTRSNSDTNTIERCKILGEMTRI